MHLYYNHLESKLKSILIMDPTLGNSLKVMRGTTNSNDQHV